MTQRHQVAKQHI